MTLFWNFELFRFQGCKKKQLWPTTGITGGDLATAGTVVVRGAGHGPRGPLRPAPGPGLARHRWFGCFWRTRAPRASGRAGSERGCGGAPDSGETRETCWPRRSGACSGRNGGAEAGVEAAGAGWLGAAPRAGRALVRLSAHPRQPRGLPARGEPLLGEGAARPRGSGDGGSRPGLMSKSMPFLGASLCSSPSSSKANRLPRVISSPFAKSA